MQNKLFTIKIIHVWLYICIQAFKLYFVFQVSREAEYLPLYQTGAPLFTNIVLDYDKDK